MLGIKDREDSVLEADYQEKLCTHLLINLKDLTYFCCSISHELTCLHLELVVQDAFQGTRVGRAWRRGGKRKDKKREIELKKVSKECSVGLGFRRRM
jgi:hypothetical protein